MTTRFRIAAFGSAAALIIAGVACAALISGGTGQILAMALIGLGLVAATSLVKRFPFCMCISFRGVDGAHARATA